MAAPRPRARLSKLQTDTQGEIVRLLRLAQARIKTQLAGQPTDYQRWALPQLERQIAQQLAVFERGAGPVVTDAAKQGWEAGVDLVDQTISRRPAGALVQATLSGLDTEQLTAMQSFMTSKIRDISLTVANKINSELALVVIGAQSPGDAVAKLVDIFGGQRQRAINIVRTEVGRAFSVAAQNRMAQAAPKLPGLQKQWRRSGKKHSRANHDAIDGQIRDVDQPFETVSVGGEIVRLMHPRDPRGPVGETINCGCESIPFMASWTVSTPGAKPFTDAELTPAELLRNPVKRAFVAKRDREKKAPK